MTEKKPVELELSERQSRALGRMMISWAMLMQQAPLDMIHELQSSGLHLLTHFERDESLGWMETARQIHAPYCTGTDEKPDEDHVSYDENDEEDGVEILYLDQKQIDKLTGGYL